MTAATPIQLKTKSFTHSRILGFYISVLTGNYPKVIGEGGVPVQMLQDQYMIIYGKYYGLNWLCQQNKPTSGLRTNWAKFVKVKFAGRYDESIMMIRDEHVYQEHSRQLRAVWDRHHALVRDRLCVCSNLLALKPSYWQFQSSME